ncbi:MAG: Mth938-like domain-containing protein [Candidatus Bathyarchaeota archaeon]|nr:Mth938-like domain-containing protein [Candidatus Bathyarchaeota archaeon]
MIDSYDFGVIVINGKRYTSDVIVFPERVIDGWWRREGHRLCVEDLKEIFKREPKPEVLVVGTGYYGLVKVSPEVENALKSHGIELVAQPTREACQTFNELLKSNRRVAGTFHLTC